MYLYKIINEDSYRMELKALIAECTAYDFKVMLEEKKPKSWLKRSNSFSNIMVVLFLFDIDFDGVIKDLKYVELVIARLY